MAIALILVLLGSCVAPPSNEEASGPPPGAVQTAVGTPVARSAFDPFSVMPGPVKAFVRECVVEKAGRETLDRLERERTASGAEQELVRWCEDNARASLGDRAQPLAVAAPPDHAVDRSVGQVIVSTWNPVTITPFEDQADLYFTIRNVGATIATVEIDGTAAQRVALATWDTHLLAFHELVGGASPFFVLAPTRLEPGQSASLRVRLPFGAGQIREFVELILPFTFRVQETGDQDTIPIAIRTQAGLAFTAFAKTSQIVGRVAATDGRPIGGALVQVWIGMTSDPVSIRTWTDGTYKIAVPSGADLRTVLGPRPRVWTETAMTYSLSASQRGYSYGYRAGIVPEPGRAAQIDLTLRPLPPLSYRVAGEFKTSGPIGFWWVRLAGAGNLIVATEGRHDPSLRVPAHIYGLDLAGQERWSIPTGDQCWGLDVSDDGQLIAAGCADSFVYVITASGQLLRKIGGIFGEGPFQPRFSPDGRLLLADTRTGPSVIDPRSGAVLWSISSRLTSHQVRNVRWSPDRQRVVIGDAEGRLTMVDVTGRLLWQVYLGHLTFSLSIDERYNVYVGSKSGVYYAFDAQGNRRWEWGRSSYHGPRQMPTDGRFVVLSPGSKKIVEMLDSSGTLLWDHHFGHPREAVGGGAGHNAIDITPDGTLIAVGFEDNEVVLMDARGDLLWTDRRSVRPELAPMVSTDAPGIQGVAISADGRYIVVGFQDSVIRVFERQ